MAHQLSVRLSDQTWERLGTCAASVGQTRGAWVRATLEDAFAESDEELMHEHVWEPFGDLHRCACGAIGA